jgi:hypothetical protein
MTKWRAVRLQFCRGMDTKRWTLSVAAALLGACSATAPAPAPQTTPAAPPAATATAVPRVKETPAAALQDRAGDSIETAVAVPADAPQEGYDFMNNWIWERVGKFRRLGGGTGSANGRRYNVVEVETPKGDHYKFFFDITENWNRWKLPSQ